MGGRCQGLKGIECKMCFPLNSEDIQCGTTSGAGWPGGGQWPAAPWRGRGGAGPAEERLGQPPQLEFVPRIAAPQPQPLPPVIRVFVAAPPPLRAAFFAPPPPSSCVRYLLRAAAAASPPPRSRRRKWTLMRRRRQSHWSTG
uniref:Uncharacterized protein n=1 Tax=Oryza sativa subsp. japonica TaxID=39947 RepID=Q6ER20_ORYSJ|nr:hypothetical protein [Oryza sativa Japonica Group]